MQEAKAKWPAIMAGTPGIELHLIGPLQSNKAKDAVALFDAIHSVDRPSICEALAKEIEKQGRSPTLFVQINTGEEPQKAGIAPSEADAFIATCRKDFGLTISGLMCIPPVEDAPAPHFALTAKIAARNGSKAPVDGNERRFRCGHSNGRDPYSRGVGDLRASHPQLASSADDNPRSPVESRASSRSIDACVIAMQPAVGAKPGRARCRNTALPRPAMRGRVL